MMKLMSGRLFLSLAIAALALVSLSPLRAWQWVPIPSDQHLVNTVTPADFDEDGNPESLVLTGAGQFIYRQAI